MNSSISVTAAFAVIALLYLAKHQTIEQFLTWAAAPGNAPVGPQTIVPPPQPLGWPNYQNSPPVPGG